MIVADVLEKWICMVKDLIVTHLTQVAIGVMLKGGHVVMVGGAKKWANMTILMTCAPKDWEIIVIMETHVRETWFAKVIVVSNAAMGLLAARGEKTTVLMENALHTKVVEDVVVIGLVYVARIFIAKMEYVELIVDTMTITSIHLSATRLMLCVIIG